MYVYTHEYIYIYMKIFTYIVKLTYIYIHIHTVYKVICSRDSFVCRLPVKPVRYL